MRLGIVSDEFFEPSLGAMGELCARAELAPEWSTLV